MHHLTSEEARSFRGTLHDAVCGVPELWRRRGSSSGKSRRGGSRTIWGRRFAITASIPGSSSLRRVPRHAPLAGASLVIGTVCVLRREKALHLLQEAFARVRSVSSSLLWEAVWNLPASRRMPCASASTMRASSFRPCPTWCRGCAPSMCPFCPRIPRHSRTPCWRPCLRLGRHRFSCGRDARNHRRRGARPFVSFRRFRRSGR